MPDMGSMGGSVEASAGDRSSTGTGNADGGSGGGSATSSTANASDIASGMPDFGPMQFTTHDATAIAGSLAGPALLGVAILTAPAATIAAAPMVLETSLISTGAALAAFAKAPSSGDLTQAFSHAAHDVLARAAPTIMQVDPAGLGIYGTQAVNLGYGIDGQLDQDVISLGFTKPW